MKATKKQIDYINAMYKDVYTQEQLDMLTTKTASELISALKLWCRPRGRIDNYYIFHTFEYLCMIEQKVFGTCVSNIPT